MNEMSFREKACAGISILLIFTAVFNAVGLLADFPEIFANAMKVDPKTAVGFMVIFTAVITIGLATILPKKTAILALLPLAIFAAYWLREGWDYFVRKSEAVTDTNVLFIHLATVALGICVACHSIIDGRKPTNSQRFMILIAFTLMANAFALFLTACLNGSMEEVKQKSIQRVTLEQQVLMAPVSNETTGNSLTTKSQPESDLTAK